MSGNSAKPISMACDHGGYELKQTLARDLADGGYEVLDLGTDSVDSVDYPDYAELLAQSIRDGRAEQGVLICGSGIGMSIAANRHCEIRAALVHETNTAELARQHNDANVIVFGGRFIEADMAKACLKTFLATPSEGGRHARRVAKLSQQHIK